MLKEGMLWASRNEWLKQFVATSELARPLVERFVAGETLPEALQAVEKLNEKGIHVSVDFLGEEVHDTAAAVSTRDEYLRMLDEIHQRGLDANISLKLTQQGLVCDPRECEENVRTILERATQCGNFVRIDMEGSANTQATLDMFYRLYADYQNVGPVMQSMLLRTHADLYKLLEVGAQIRLCKGAYKEPSSIAYTFKSQVDENYRQLMEELLMSGNYPGIATHDEKLIHHAICFAHERRILDSDFEFQMLYGVRRDLQEWLAGEGYNVRVYVPYGTEWYPYLMRRMAERPANMWFVMKNMVKESRLKAR